MTWRSLPDSASESWCHVMVDGVDLYLTHAEGKRLVGAFTQSLTNSDGLPLAGAYTAVDGEAVIIAHRQVGYVKCSTPESRRRARESAIGQQIRQWRLTEWEED